MRRLEWGRMRRLRLCLANTDSGALGSVRPYYGGLPL
jgi:hypothetical protein